ncbi:MAG: ATP-binding protein [Verrucomicrobiales bacterium]|nr:ATP-binding protein [Verrucomicrobiales bacterium]
MIDRPQVIQRVLDELAVHPSVALLGPRQCGKTTLAHVIAARHETGAFLDLERTVDRRKLESPEQALGGLTGLVVIDEIQRQPGLFETLRVLLDRPGADARFLLLGSASPILVKGISESLAGRAGMVDLGGFDLSETGPGNWRTLWQRGGFPRSFLAAEDAASLAWRESFVRTFLERDIPQLGIRIPAETLRRFWTMIAHWHGQVWNAAEFARALGANEVTARRYLDILAGAYMVRVLPPWFENLKKRQVKAPKIYIRDSGLLHALLELRSMDDLAGHPKRGASWEGFAIEQVLAAIPTRSAYFWGTHAGAELDLMITVGGRRYGFECKHTDAPGTTRAMRVALADLGLEHLWVVYPGSESYELAPQISVLPAREIPALGSRLAGSLAN